jgi:hypothetical protein
MPLPRPGIRASREDTVPVYPCQGLAGAEWDEEL